MTKYTFTFEKSEEKHFRHQLSRMEPEWYTILEDIRPVEEDEKGRKYHDPFLQCVIEMDSVDASNYFRMPMGNAIKIRRERTEEELALEKEQDERHTIRINVQVPMGDSGT